MSWSNLNVVGRTLKQWGWWPKQISCWVLKMIWSMIGMKDDGDGNARVTKWTMQAKLFIYLFFNGLTDDEQ